MTLDTHFLRHAIAYASALMDRTKSLAVKRHLAELIEELKGMRK